jgi:5-(carboxyamino)imidazole ribonucleotide synthase
MTGVVTPGRAPPQAGASAPPLLVPGATLAVMGGGQLARMFVQAAQRLGYETAVLDPDPASPAGRIAHHHVVGDYLDPQALDRLAELGDAITTEFENVPAHALAALAKRRAVAPAAAAVAVCQDRAAEKAHFTRSGVACAAHAVIRTAEDLAGVHASLLPGILKTARLGYDGKGQRQVATPAELAAAWRAFGGVACVLEQRLALAFELSVIVARGADGTVVHLPVQQNLHRDGILAVTQVPAPNLSPELQRRAITGAIRIADSLDYVGVLCVEFFVPDDGTLIANEMAPRPHNSGHYSIDACDLSQFELQVRTLAGAPLVPPRQHSACVMLNLLGDLWSPSGRAPDWSRLLELPGAHLHLYGKAQARPGRKMGHLTCTATESAQAAAVAREASARLGLPAW